MPLKKHYLSTEIALILSAGVFLGLNSETAQAQPPQYSCRPNAQNDGWVCAAPDRAPALPSPNASQRYRPISEPNVFVPVPELESEPESVSGLSEVELKDSQTSTADSGASSNIETPHSVIPAKQYPLDWVPRAELSSAQIAALPANCCGAFIDPSLVLKTPENDPALAPTTFNTVSGSSLLRGTEQFKTIAAP
jgi:hypothetical protein